MNGQRRRFKGLILRNEANKSFVMNNHFRTLFSQHPPKAYAKGGATTGAAMLATAMLPQTWHRRSHAFQTGKTLSLERSNAARPCGDSQGEAVVSWKSSEIHRLRKKDFELGGCDFGCQQPVLELRFPSGYWGRVKRKGEEWPLATLN